MKRRPRRILSIGHSYCVALNRRLAHEMARAGGAEWEVTAVAPAFFHADFGAIACERFAGESCRLEAIPAYMTGRIHLFVYGRRLRELIRQNCDLVHCWEEPYILAGAQTAWWTPRDVPFVFWTMQNLVKRYPPPFSLIEKYCFDRCAGWFGSGQLVVEAMCSRGYGGKPHRAMPIGVDADLFRPDPAAREATRTRLGWNSLNPPVVGFVGRFIEGKGLVLMMAALDRLREPWRALFIGGGKLEPALRAWAARHNDRVRIVNDVAHDQVPAYLNAMDLLCAPSQTTPGWREQFGRMVVEAFACGIPVISSDSGELPYVVGDAGVIVGERDEDTWVRAMSELIDDPAARLELSRKGIERARSQYAWPIVARNHLEFFSRLLDGGAALQ
jgi:glycosyltransferase involved in cell wall biosynthesis